MTLPTKIVLGLALGAAAGVGAHAFLPGAPWVGWVADNVAGPVGQVFLRILVMTGMPLVVTSIALGVVRLGGIRKLARVGIRTLAYFVLSSALAALVGLVLVNACRPGAALAPALREGLVAAYRAPAEALAAAAPARFGLDMLVNIIPRNPIQAAAGMDLVGVIFFSLVFGAALTLIPDARARPLVRVLDAAGEAIVKIIELAMRLAPYGVCGLMFVTTSRFGWGMLAELGRYVAVVLVGLAIYGILGLSVLVRALGGLAPRVFWSRVGSSVATAFSTSSTAAALATNIVVAERELEIPPAIARFVLPLGAALCLNGTALYQGVTVLFLAQVFGVRVDLAAQLLVLLLSVITAVGAAGVAGGALPLLLVILASVGVPAEGIAVVLGVDRLLNMGRTTIDVCGDLVAAVYVARRESAGDPHAVEGVAGLARLA